MGSHIPHIRLLSGRCVAWVSLPDEVLVSKLTHQLAIDVRGRRDDDTPVIRRRRLQATDVRHVVKQLMIIRDILSGGAA